MIAVVILACWYGWTNLDAYLSNRHLASLGYSLLGFSGGIGLLLGQRWARFPIYGVTLLTMVVWCYLMVRALQAGVRYETGLQTFFGILISLVPSLVAALCSYIVYRRFSGAR